MDDRRIPGAQGADRGGKQRAKRSRGLKLIERGGYWHVHGTLHVGDESCRVRKSTGLPATRDNEEAAGWELRNIEKAFKDQVIHGIKPSRSFAEVALDYLERPRSRPLNHTDVRNVKRLAAHFGTIDLRKVDETAIAAYFKKHHSDKALPTLERIKNTLLAVLRFAHRHKLIDQVPHIERNKHARNPLLRRRIHGEALLFEDAQLIVDCAAFHLRPQLAVKAVTGARDPQLAGARICDFILPEGRARVIFRGAKNDDDDICLLPDWVARIVRDYFEQHRAGADREAPAFLTHRGKPYADTGGRHGGRIQTGFRSAKHRAARLLLRDSVRIRRAGELEAAADLKLRAKRVWRATPHDFRRTLATQMLAEGADAGTVGKQGMWRDPRMIAWYQQDLPDYQRQLVNRTLADKKVPRKASFNPNPWVKGG